MPIEVHYDPHSKTLYGRVFGAVIADDLISSFESVRAVGDIPLDADMVWDMRTMDFTALTIELLREIVKRRKQLNTHRTDCASAYVVIGPQEERMIRLMIAVSVGVKRREAIFRTMDEARHWIQGLRGGYSEEPTPPPQSMTIPLP